MTPASSGQSRRTSRRNAACSSGKRVADGVGEVDRRRAGLDRGARDLRDEGGIGAGRVLAAELDLVDAPDDVRDGASGLLDDLGRLEPELVLHVDRARPEDDVDARPPARVRERLDGGVEILLAAPGRTMRPSARVTAAPTARTPSKSPGEENAKPASITSTPRRSSASAISAFSSGESAMPGDCSPSLSVVSKIVILRAVLHVLLLLSGAPEDAPVLCFGRRLRLDRRVGRVSP